MYNKRKFLKKSATAVLGDESVLLFARPLRLIDLNTPTKGCSKKNEFIKKISVYIYIRYGHTTFALFIDVSRYIGIILSVSIIVVYLRIIIFLDDAMSEKKQPRRVDF